MIFVFTLVACGSGAANPTLPAPALKANPSATFIATGVRPTLYKTLPKADCQNINDGLAVTFRVSAGMSESSFADPLNGDLGNGCLFDLRGTGEEFISLPATLDNLRALLKKSDWLEDKTYATNTPTSSATGFRKQTALLLAAATWKPAAEANCLPDQLATCKLTPKQQQFSLVIKAAQR